MEGTFAPFEQVLAAEVADNQLSKELLEVMNYVEAADAAFQFVGERGAITVGLLESVHSILVRGTDSETRDAGRIRSTLVAIGSPTGAVADARFVPMLAKRFDRTSSAVTSVLTKLVELNILSGPFGTYNRQYMARDVWIALTAPVGAVPSAQARLHFEGRE